MKSLFKSKPKTPADLVRQTRYLLMSLDLGGTEGKESKREEKMMELSKLIRELKQVLYGNSESEPVAEACAQLTSEFFRENTLRLLIICLPKLNLEARKDATQVVANLQRQQVQSRLIACDYLENNLDLLDILLKGYENSDLALHYGAMLRECIRHQSVARYVLESEHMKNFFDLIQLPNFDIASDAAATFKVKAFDEFLNQRLASFGLSSLCHVIPCPEVGIKFMLSLQNDWSDVHVSVFLSSELSYFMGSCMLIHV